MHWEKIEHKPKPNAEEPPFVLAEVQPEFPGGCGAMSAWLRDLINYPEIAKENNIQGKVIIQFVVEKDGSVTNVRVKKGVDPSLDKEALRVVSQMPNWKPGMLNGTPVRVVMSLPVNFKLN